MSLVWIRDEAQGKARPVQDPGSNTTTTDKARQTEGGIITERLLEFQAQAEAEHSKFKANLLFVTSTSNSKTLFQNKIQQKGLGIWPNGRVHAEDLVCGGEKKAQTVAGVATNVRD